MSKRGNPSDFETSLTREALLRVLSYDPATGEFRWLDNRHGRVKVGSLAGTVDDREYQGYRRIELNGRGYYASRLAWLYMTGSWPEGLIDHENGVYSDDRWDNLRPADRVDNGRNRKVNKNSKTGVNGVYWHSTNGKWAAQVIVDKKRIFLGSFETQEEAIKARRDAETAHFGEFQRRA